MKSIIVQSSMSSVFCMFLCFSRFDVSKLVSKNIYKAQENNLSQCAVVKQQTGAISVCA